MLHFKTRHKFMNPCYIIIIIYPISSVKKILLDFFLKLISHRKIKFNRLHRINKMFFEFKYSILWKSIVFLLGNLHSVNAFWWLLENNQTQKVSNKCDYTKYFWHVCMYFLYSKSENYIPTNLNSLTNWIVYLSYRWRWDSIGK